MKKNTYLKIIGGVASTIALTTVAPASFALDYYAGVAGGVSSLSVKSNSSTLYGTSTPYDATDASTTGSATGATGELYLGLAAQPMGRFYLGSELNVSGFTGSATTSIPANNVSESQTYDSKVKYALGISVMPGFVVSDKTLLFTRIGYEYMGFDNYVSDDNQNQYSSGSGQSGVSAYRLGLGVERYITSNLSLRMEGDYWHLGVVNSSQDLNPGAVSGQELITNADYHPNIFTGMIGLSYHFGAQSDSK